jgi:Uma2 family endonuclease
VLDIVPGCVLANGRAPSVRFDHDARDLEPWMAHAATPNVMLMTPDEFLVHPLEDMRAELVRGELGVTPPAGGPHGRATANLVFLLMVHARARGLGSVFVDGVGYELVQLPRTVRVPDASFVAAGRLPAAGIVPGLLKLAPDLAVEVLSPSETASELAEKLDDYRMCGTPLIWVIDPVRRSVAVYASNAPVRWLHEADTLDGGEIIPGFACRVAEIFQGIARDAS